jgi:hypothetical protein
LGFVECRRPPPVRTAQPCARTPVLQSK